jgi:hypothetical protein
MRGLRHAALLLALCATTAGPVRASEPWTSDDVFASMAAHSDVAACVVRYEIGGTGFDPYARGSAGELGPAQLLPGGQLDVFMARGYSDPFSPWQSLDFLDDAIARGEGRYWSTFHLCVETP